MSEKKGKITESKFVRTWDGGSNGPVHYHSLVMDNGDFGQTTAKTIDTPAEIAVGREITYTIAPDGEYQGQPRFKIKLVRPGGGKFGGGKPWTPESEYAKHIGFSMAYAKDLVVAGKVTEQQMFKTADMIYEWMKKKAAAERDAASKVPTPPAQN
jgi:hypothetical protein